MPETNPPTINLQEVNTRNDAARHILAGFSTAMPALAEFWAHLEEALNDTDALAAEIMQYRAGFQSLRLDLANLAAAARASIAAYDDAEPDPLWYLRDEMEQDPLASQALPPAAQRRA
jgi:hypothetical protein